jgi:hypothetical protein
MFFFEKVLQYEISICCEWIPDPGQRMEEEGAGPNAAHIMTKKTFR